ncbi:helix-turn-helix family protein [Asticcacaulis biprosthecium C19]|uniref:Helix-turn-helix family protein n=1 Tax=Asticcacaulis biprosthecium C19 TaxID=715226 RepID=F4QMI8_9CAUL|nr:helix-turn-helix transcriptional regulator [Asticcacaulis biprosthecium]EGF91429.1 helix-turn-helix family protein [Asticcacaulis biprosthecium C19]
MALSLFTPNDVLTEICQGFKALRLESGLTQEGLARRSGVSLGSLKRFETTGQINFESLLRLALVLGRLDDFHRFSEKLAEPVQRTLADFDDTVTQPRRGRRK